jgi:hypothetical protein
MDANGRILPCCDVHSDPTWVFGDAMDGDVFNSDMYRSARELGAKVKTACHDCPSVDGSFVPTFTASQHFPQYVEKINWAAPCSALSWSHCGADATGLIMRRLIPIRPLPFSRPAY